MLWITKPYTKVAVITDPHAHKKTLQALIAQIPPEYTIIINGDLVDKGDDAKGVVAEAKKYDNTLGNHDMLMTVENHPKFWKRYESIWLGNNGKDTIKSYGDKWKILNVPENKKQFREDVNFLKSLPLVIELPNIMVADKPVIVSHSSIGPALNYFGGIEELKDVLNNTPRQELLGEHLRPAKEEEPVLSKAGMVQSILWTQVPSANDLTRTGFFNVVGHTVQPNGVTIGPDGACLDCGVYNFNKMCALLLPEMIILEQELIPDKEIPKK